MEDAPAPVEAKNVYRGRDATPAPVAPPAEPKPVKAKAKKKGEK